MPRSSSSSSSTGRRPAAKTAAPRADASLTPSERFAGTRRAHRDETIEDYVEAIAQLERAASRTANTNDGDEPGVRVKDLALMMGVSHVTVVKIVRRLSERGLVVTQRGRPLHLTPDGRRLADAAEARHETVLGFLRWLGVPAQQAEIDAEGIEHHVSQQTIDAMKRAMGNEKA